MLTRRNIAIAVVSLLVIVAVVEYVWIYVLPEDEPTTGELANRAFKAPEVDEREAAVVKLANKGRSAVPELRKVLVEAREPEIKAAAVRGLGESFDFASMDRLLDAMEDPSPLVRARAHAAVSRMLGPNAHFDPHAPAAERRKIVKFYRDEWKALRNSQRLREHQARLDRNLGPIAGQ
ncbi:MAG: HEAT repeat domain-containing protein [Phycisphaerae bacterium]